MKNQTSDFVFVFLLSGFGQGCSGFWSLDAPIVPFDLLFSLDPHYYLHLCLVSPDCI
jgi:hypothetical protein